MESDSSSTAIPPPSFSSTITLKHQQHDPLHSISSASSPSCKNISPKPGINEMEEEVEIEEEQNNDKTETVEVSVLAQRLQEDQEEEGKILARSLSCVSELPAEVEAAIAALAAATAQSNSNDGNGGKTTTPSIVTITNTPRHNAFSRQNSNSHALINSFFEESDADFLERGLIGKYDDDNNTPAATVNNTPHTEPISSSCIALSPPSMDLGRSSVDVDVDVDIDHGDSDGHNDDNGDNDKDKNKNCGPGDSECIGKRSRSISTSTSTRNISASSKNKSANASVNANDDDDNYDYNYKISTPLIPPSSTAATALVAAGKNFQSFLPQLHQLAQQQRQQQEEEERCDSKGLMINDDNDHDSNEDGICGLIDRDSHQNSTSAINGNGDDGINDNDDTLSPLCSNHDPKIESTPNKSSMVQSKSYHRRLHETAQFAEAVGELPRDGLIQVIIDDDDVNESDEDDEEEHHHEHDGKMETGGSCDDISGGLGNVSCNMDGDEDYDQIIVMDSDYPTMHKRDDDATRVQGDIHDNISIIEMDNIVSSPLKSEDEGVVLSPTPSSPIPLSPIPKSRPSSSGAQRVFPINEDCVVSTNNTAPCDLIIKTDTEAENHDATTQEQVQEKQKKSQGQQLLSSFPTLKLPKLNYFLHHLPCKHPEEKLNAPPSTQSSLIPTSSSTITPSTNTGSSSMVSTQIISNSNTENHYVYKGIQHNPPEITKRGISRGNYAQLHRKAWLEVSDKYHRYGKNLRLYYKHWESLGHPTNMFFEWLDSKGEAAGWEKPNLSECPRSVLDSDRVLYIMDQEAQNRYLLKIKLVEETTSEEESIAATALQSPTTSMTQIVDYNGDVVRTGPNGWIFVLRDHELYGAEKCTRYGGNSKFRFHHSSFFGGKAVAAAGILITDDNGCLKRLYPHSGHYRPGEAHMQRMLFYLYQSNVDLDSFEVDMQQIMHVSREVRDKRTPKGGSNVEPTNAKKVNNSDTSNSGGCGDGPSTKKAKKTESLHLKNATFVALFLAHKAKLIRVGVLSMIRKIRSIHTSKRSVRNILNVVDEGGFWHRNDTHQML